ncbi:NHL repeat-containing protein [Bdellovibrio bacteriovorus]|uniref:NHL repeat-containing protein n=1 Tax=Bdellovibrio bacteriovorus TaxID=959 RepID=UPI0035A6A9E0
MHVIGSFIALFFMAALLGGCSLDVTLRSSIMAQLDSGSELPPYVPAGIFPIQKEKFNFGQPLDIGFTSSGELVVGTYNNIEAGIQKFDMGTGKRTLKFGPLGTMNDSQISGARRVHVDSSDNIWVMDANPSIRIFSPSGTLIRKIGSQGTGTTQFSGALDFVLDKNGTVYVADTWNHRIQVYANDGTHLRSIGLGQGAGDGQMNQPYSVDVDQNLNVYVVDHLNHRIQKFDSSGNFVSKFGSHGTGPGQFQSAMRIRISTSGDIFVPDPVQGILKFDSTGAYQTTWLGVAPGHTAFESPMNIALAPDGKIYVVDLIDMMEYRLEVLDATGAWQETLTNYSDAEKLFTAPTSLWIDKDDNIFVADSYDGTKDQRIVKFDKLGNHIIYIGSLGTGPGQFTKCDGVATDSEGHIYGVDSGGNKINKYSADGTYLTSIGSLGSGDGQLNLPMAIFVDKNDVIYVADQANSRIQKFSSAGTYLGQFGNSGSPVLTQPQGLYVDEAGTAYVIDIGVSKVFVFDSSGNYLRNFSVPTNTPHIYVDKSGKIYITELVGSFIEVYSNAGVLQSKLGGKGWAPGKFYYPWGIGADSHGNLFISDLFTRQIQRISPTGIPL